MAGFDEIKVCWDKSLHGCSSGIPARAQVVARVPGCEAKERSDGVLEKNKERD